MKRIISILTAITVMAGITACNNKKDNSTENAENGWRIVSSYNMVEEEKNGMFTVGTTGSLEFIDFSTMEQTPLCDKPQCKHDSDDCNSFDKNNHPFLYDGKLYFFRNTEIYQDGKNYSRDTKLYQCEINGSDEKEIAKFTGLTYEDYDRLILNDDTIYMCMDNQPYDKDYNELEPSEEFVSYDLQNGEIKNYGEIVKGWSCGSWVFGIWNEKIIFQTSKAKVNLPYLDRVQKYADENNLKTDEAAKSYVDEYDNEYFQFDIDKGTISANTDPIPSAVSHRFYYYLENGKLMYIDTDGKKNTIDNCEKITDIDVFNGYALLSNKDDEFLFNEKNQSLAQLNGKYFISATRGENAIFSIVNDDGTLSFEKKKISELEK